MQLKNVKTIEFLFKRMGIKFTKTYLCKLYNIGPDRNTLFGILNVLSKYGINHIIFKMKNKDEINSIDTPFIVILKGKVVVVDQVMNGIVSYAEGDQKVNISSDEFVELWDGVILMPEAVEYSGEPNYELHRRQCLFNLIRRNVFLSIILLLFFVGLVLNNTYHDIYVFLLMLINTLGIYISWLLLQKQLNIPNDHADRICTILKRGNCNRVLTSPAAKIMGVIAWSEIGLSYFISNVFIAILVPYLVPYLALINVMGLPYSIWSIWYQKCKVKQWCPLCLIVQFLLWMIFLVNILFINMALAQYTLLNFVLTGCIYGMSFLVINILLVKLNDGKYTEYLEKELYCLKINPEVFKALLYQQTHYAISSSVSRILWGNRDARIIFTVVINPDCYHCAKMHKRVVQLLAKAGDRICIQYIFRSFGKVYDSGSLFLISVYFSNVISESKKMEIYDNWFVEGRINKDKFFKKYDLKTDQKIVRSELECHQRWDGMKGLDGTPTVFINGYQLPDLYQIEDLICFFDLEI